MDRESYYLSETHMLFYLIYISKSAKTMSDDSLQQILETSRAWNVQHAITGMLIYVEGKFMSPNKANIDEVLEGRFIQVLEGPESDVMEIFELIRKDNRHHGLMVLKTGGLSERNFKDWHMGFKRINNHNNDEGFIHLDDWFAADRPDSGDNTPLKFLKSFYQAVQNKQ